MNKYLTKIAAKMSLQEKEYVRRNVKEEREHRAPLLSNTTELNVEGTKRTLENSKRFNAAMSKGHRRSYKEGVVSKAAPSVSYINHRSLAVADRLKAMEHGRMIRILSKVRK